MCNREQKITSIWGFYFSYGLWEWQFQTVEKTECLKTTSRKNIFFKYFIFLNIKFQQIEEGFGYSWVVFVFITSPRTWWFWWLLFLNAQKRKIRKRPSENIFLKRQIFIFVLNEKFHRYREGTGFLQVSFQFFLNFFRALCFIEKLTLSLFGKNFV